MIVRLKYYWRGYVVCVDGGLMDHNCRGSATVYSLPSNVFFFFFRLDALALSVISIATATWLAGWLAGWLSHSGIVSKRLNLSENIFDHLKAPSF